MASAPPSLESSLLGKYYCRLSIGDYSRPTPFTSSNFTIKKIINLPLPTELSDSTPIGYSSAEFESVGDLVNMDPAGAAESYSLRNASWAIGKIGSLAGEAFSAIEKNSRIISSAIQQAAGIAPNPNPTVVFTGSSLRDFSLTWMFAPKNSRESANLQKVIKILKASALPENSIALSGAILKYPSIVQLNFYPWDDKAKMSDHDIHNQWGWTENSIIKIKKCMMASVNVNYTPSNVPAFFKADTTTGTKYQPVAVSVSISFKEIEYMLSGDWGGDWGGDSLPTEPPPKP